MYSAKDRGKGGDSALDQHKARCDLEEAPKRIFLAEIDAERVLIGRESLKAARGIP